MRKFKNGIYSLIIILILFEISYRLYIIDFYKGSWTYLNSKEELQQANVDLFIFGDSFSTFPNGYISDLKKEFSDKVILNSSVSGTGLNQVNLFVSQRVKNRTPQKVLYQVYVGNDLIDLKHLTNWKELSIKRNIYWEMSNYFLSISYLNQRLSSFSKIENESHPIFNPKFEVDGYTARSKLYFKSDDFYLDKTINLQNDFSKRYSLWRKKLNYFINQFPVDTEIILLFVPHCSQVNNYYLKNMKELGGKFNSEYLNSNYEFFERAKKDFSHFQNVKFLNPLSFLKEKDIDNNRLYYANDPHLNSKGQKELFNYVKDKIFK